MLIICAHLVLIMCSSCAHHVLNLWSPCAHLVHSGAKLSVVKQRRRIEEEVSKEMPINVPIIMRKYHLEHMHVVHYTV